MDIASTLGTTLNVGRIAYGIAAVVSPTKAAKGWIGRAAKQPSVHPMTRAFGIRDVALGAVTTAELVPFAEETLEEKNRRLQQELTHQ